MDAVNVRHVEEVTSSVEGARDCMAVIADHTEFKSLNLNEIKAIMNGRPSIIDGRRITSSDVAENAGFTYMGIGLGNAR